MRGRPRQASLEQMTEIPAGGPAIFGCLGFVGQIHRSFLGHRIPGSWVTNESFELRYGENGCAEYLIGLFKIFVPCYKVSRSP